MLKNPPAIQETLVRFLSQEDPLEKGTATTPVILHRESHGQRSLVVYSPSACKELDTTERLPIVLNTLIWLQDSRSMPKNLLFISIH